MKLNGAIWFSMLQKKKNVSMSCFLTNKTKYISCKILNEPIKNGGIMKSSNSWLHYNTKQGWSTFIVKRSKSRLLKMKVVKLPLLLPFITLKEDGHLTNINQVLLNLPPPVAFPKLFICLQISSPCAVRSAPVSVAIQLSEKGSFSCVMVFPMWVLLSAYSFPHILIFCLHLPTNSTWVILSHHFSPSILYRMQFVNAYSLVMLLITFVS